jgi:hypothetical protein
VWEWQHQHRHERAEIDDVFVEQWVDFCDAGTGELRKLFPACLRTHIVGAGAAALAGVQPDGDSDSSQQALVDLSAILRVDDEFQFDFGILDGGSGSHDSFMSFFPAPLPALPPPPPPPAQPLVVPVASGPAPATDRSKLELRVGDWVAYIVPERAWSVQRTQVVGVEMTRRCALTLANNEHDVLVTDEQLAFARYDPATDTLLSPLARLDAFTLVM